MDESTVHELKIWKQYFDDVESGRKPFEVRKLDRLFGVGHVLHLREWGPIDGYSGRETKKIITYVMNGGKWGLLEGNCILGIAPITTRLAALDDGSGWVSVNERLPKKNEEYIVCGTGFEGKIVTTLEWKKGKWFSDVYQKYIEQIKITHWQPLPKSPNNDN